jgi:hypothetical protein
MPSYEKLDIYSALRDPKSGDVRLFLEYYIKHASQMSEEEAKGAFPSFSDVFEGCLFSNTRDFADSVTVPAHFVRAAALHAQLCPCEHAHAP